jgi:hypothetical protein
MPKSLEVTVQHKAIVGAIQPSVEVLAHIQGEPREKRRAGTHRTLNEKSPPQRLDPILQSSKPASAIGIRAPHTVVVHRDLELAVLFFHFHFRT